MSRIITTGIDQVRVEDLSPGDPRGGGRMVSFRSANAGLHHQLYVNGQLAGWTDSPQVRNFFLDEPAGPAALCVVAVDGTDWQADLSDQLPTPYLAPPWVYRPRLLRAAPIRDGGVIEVLGDHATGVLDPLPLAEAPIWPAQLPRWAFGQDRFGHGGFGYDGANGPGTGMGAFGAGPFGIDAGLLDLVVALEEDGVHTIMLRTRTADGRTSDSGPISVAAHPPPAAPSSLTVLAYDPGTCQLTLEID